MPKIPSLWREFAAIALRRKRPSAVIAASYPVGERYGVANGPVSSILVPIVLIGLLSDVPLSLVIVALSHPTHPALIQAGVAAFGLLTLGWAVAKRSTQRGIPHLISSDALWVGGGARISAVLPKLAIERVIAIRGSRRDWMKEHEVTRHEIILGSDIDPPNVAVEIKKSAWDALRISSRRKYRQPRRWMLLYADNPTALATNINSSIVI